ncbi:MAG: DUF1016 N-terminal domain-containing protein [Sulfuritalea sp.]|nr:DUF1016 N-terminal domain-containing protein [Sulfuritalea sp.]MDP1983222.1 DUF1016 N-terminal domain-containing protein [Sulfuritalea sp.]
MTAGYWEIGRRIVEFEQGGKGRAAYGEALIERLAGDRTQRFGRGFSQQNLWQMRQFYLCCPIPQTVSGESKETSCAFIPCAAQTFVPCHHTCRAYNESMQFEFIESPIFTSYLPDYLTDEEYAALQEYLCEHPDSGDMVRGSGGVRKLRWARPGGGKSGGVRVCYYVRTRAGRILLLVIYAKSAKDSIPGRVLKAIKEEMEHADDD